MKPSKLYEALRALIDERVAKGGGKPKRAAKKAKVPAGKLSDWIDDQAKSGRST